MLAIEQDVLSNVASEMFRVYSGSRELQIWAVSVCQNGYAQNLMDKMEF